MSEFKVGDPVLLTLDSPGPVRITEGLKHYQDMRFRISRIKSFPGDGRSQTRGTYYELKGCVSEQGVPYGVTEDWFEPIKELKR